MKVTFLGVGSAFSKKNGNSNLLIESGNIKLLVDFSLLCSKALVTYGLSLKDITHIFISHLHADHVSGLEEVAFMTRLVYRCKPALLSTASLLERTWATNLRGGLEFIEERPGELDPQTLGDFFTVMPLQPETWITLGTDPGLRIHLHPTNHVMGMESYGLEVEELPGGFAKRFFFSSDTKYAPDLIAHGAKTCSTLFHDCQLFDSGENNVMGVHTSYTQLLQVPAEIRRRMWLYHYGDSELPDATGDGFAGFVEQLQSFNF